MTRTPEEILEISVGIALRGVWQIECPHHFTCSLVRLVASVWANVRPDAFHCDLYDLSDQLMGIEPDDGRERIRRVLSFDQADKRRLIL